ncbi:hypothetical protein GQ42DRAFT_77067 [Ramicandelaber brevisporus]|nr:hypothetical protein GQ42DRAFT_77067 [Ramicandelaber brevisporus]
MRQQSRQPATAEHARDAIDTVARMSALLDTGLDRQTLAKLLKLTELGVNPEALAMAVKELQIERGRREEKLAKTQPT